MQHVIIVIHLMVVAALVVVVLYQKSEGGALGMGQSGLFSGRGQANALTRATSILATMFFLTSIALTVLPAWERRAKGGEDWTTAVDQPKVDFKEVPTPGAAKEQPAGDGKESIFDQLKKAQEQRQKGTQPSAAAPATPAPATPAPSATAPTTAPAPSATAPTTAPAPAQTTTPTAAESQKPALRPTQEAPSATETPKPEADTKTPAVNGGSTPAPATTWKSPTQ